MIVRSSVFFNDTATTEIYTLSLHDALPISDDGDGATPHVGDVDEAAVGRPGDVLGAVPDRDRGHDRIGVRVDHRDDRSEEHTSELQSRQYLVCRLLLEKKIIPTSSSI